MLTLTRFLRGKGALHTNFNIAALGFLFPCKSQPVRFVVLGFVLFVLVLCIKEENKRRMGFVLFFAGGRGWSGFC